MKTRKSFIIKKVSVYVLIVIVIISTIIWVYFGTLKKYNEKVIKLKTDKKTVEKEAKAKKSEKSSIQSQIRKAKIDLKKLKSQNQKDIQEYEAKMKELKKSLDQLPPIYMKADILSKLHKLAADLNLRINSADEIMIDRKFYAYVEFMPIMFNFKMEGKYFKIKEFLWYLDNVITLPDLKDKTKYWNIIVNINERNFKIIKYIEGGSNKANRKIAKPKVSNKSSRRSTKRSSRRSTKDIAAEFGTINLNSYLSTKERVLDKNNIMKVDVKLVTYFRKEK